MLTVSLFTFGLIGTCFVLLAPVIVRLFKKCSADDITSEWLSEFSPATYYPMHGLLAREDFQFLTRQPGFDFSLYRKLRRERMLIFRQYLRSLIGDFNRLHLYTRMTIARSDKDQSELIVRLATLKVRFSLAVVYAEFSYYLCLIGLGSLATRAVVAQLEELNLQFQSTLPASA